MAARTDLFVDVIVPLALPQKYTYRVPQEFNDEVRRGKRALVHFSKSKFYWYLHRHTLGVGLC